MIKVTLGKNSYSFPEAWHELKPDQYILLCANIFEYVKGDITIDEVRAKWFCAFTGITFKKADNNNDQLWENIYRISREFTFFTRIEYEKELDLIEKQLRRKLRKTPPDEIHSSDPMLRWVKKLKYEYTLDAVFAKNLLPSLSIGDKKVYGYRFDINGSVLNTTLTAEQFVNASMALDAYHKSKNNADLNLLIHILYPKSSIESIEKIDAISKFAVLLNYQAIVAYLMQKTKYSIIWYRKPDKKQKTHKNNYAVGASESLYALAKLGYGSIDDLASMNLLRYLDLLLKNIIDSVNMLNDYKLSIIEISDRTGLPVELINEILEK